MMTEIEFDKLVYKYYASMRILVRKDDLIDEYDLLWMAAMRCAMETDRVAVARYCEKEKPLLERYKLQCRQFTVYKRIATRSRKLNDVNLADLHDKFQMALRKEGKL